MAAKLTSANFQEEIDRNKVALVDFWAEWCGPCRAIAPVIDQLSEEFQGRALIAKINVDEERELAKSMGVMSIPTLIIFAGGKEAERLVGTRPVEELRAQIQKHL